MTGEQDGTARKRADRLAEQRRRVRMVGGVLVGAAAFLAVLALLLVFRTGAVPDSAVAGACPAGTLQVAAAPETVDVLTELAGRFSAQRGGNACAEVTVTGAVPAEVARALADTGAPPGDTVTDVWIPDSAVWVRQVEASPQGADLLPAERPSIARSPTVVAMPQPMAESLGWPGAQLGWSQLVGFAQDPQTWSRVGHEEWGPFRLGLADPTRSAAGLHAVLSIGAAQSQVWIDALSSDGLRDPGVRATLLTLERGTAPLRGLVDEQLAGLREADDRGEPLGAFAALPAAERDVWRYNRGLGDGTPPGVPLVAVYPSEGALAFDYPYVVLRGGRAERAELAGRFRNFLLAEDAQRLLRESGFRDAANTPGDALREAEGLAPGRAGTGVEAPDGQTVTAALASWRSLSTRLNTVAIFDVSGSMAQPLPGGQQTRLEFVVETAIRGMALFADDSNVALWEFSTDLPGGAQDGDYRELVPLGPVGEDLDGVTRRQRLVQGLQGLAPANDTALYDTLLAAYITARDAASPARPSVVALLTDGRSDGDDLSLEELLDRLRTEQDPSRPVRVAVIAFGEDPPVAELTAVTDLVGGQVFTPTTPEGIAQVFVEILTIP